MMKDKIVVSTSGFEKTTDLVLEYIGYFGGEFVRFHQDDFLTDVTIEIGSRSEVDSINLEFGNDNIVFSPTSKFWYRRGGFSFHFPFNDSNVHPKLKKQVSEEWNMTKFFLHDYLSTLGSYNREKGSNKLQDLVLARKSGFCVPETLVTGRKNILLEFLEKFEEVITKPIHNAHLAFSDDKHLAGSKGIVIVTKDLCSQLENKFAPSLFQAYVEKEVEIRVFFIQRKYYAMAIFSQNDKKTEYDYRNYNNDKPNRNVPFLLPKKLVEKLDKFVDVSGLDTGSIDLILSTDNSFYFLEVNPTGQFGWVSQECNYYIERYIAQFLIEKQNDED